ncbi:MAG: hypothetical protein PHH54_05025 [Candidatus Nanoarchaeia archaeon]|nr:hypothetical protein [Candidatus Nanoarchaeia archaeon]MDD5741321.1 hypothetical protein [Candidatus Nanoarchaeia archaeon]
MKHKSNSIRVVIILLIAVLGLFILTSLADFLKINLTTYANIIRSLR